MRHLESAHSTRSLKLSKYAMADTSVMKIQGQQTQDYHLYIRSNDSLHTEQHHTHKSGECWQEQQHKIAKFAFTATPYA